MMRATILTLGLFGCTGAVDLEPLPDWSAGMEDGSADTDDVVVDDPVLPGGVMSIRRLDPEGVTTRISLMGDPDPEARCEVVTTGDMVGYSDIECMIDEAELDLHFHGLRYSLYVGRGACEYVAWQSYMYQAWPIGYGPELVSYEFNNDGEFFNEVGTVNGVPTCEYNFSDGDEEDGPNCCLGRYTMTARNLSTGAVDVTIGAQWGGQEASCYGGAAYLDPDAAFTPEGWPLGTIVFTDGNEFVKDFEFASLSDDFRSNIPYANYYDPVDHDGGMPAGLNPEDRDIDGDGDIDLGAHFARPANIVYCLDHADEVLASITINLREWNQYSEFSAEVPGDPDTTGTEPVTGEPIPDINDWQTGTPGDDTFIMMRE